MNPGVTSSPDASSSVCASSVMAPTSTMRPSRIPTSATYGSPPVPSTTVPPLIRWSSTSIEPVEVDAVVAHDLADFFRGNALEDVADDLLAVRPRRLGMRVVVGPHDPVDAARVARLDAGRILHEREPHLALDVGRRQLGQVHVLVPAVLLVDVVDVVLPERDPTDLPFHADELEVGVLG